MVLLQGVQPVCISDMCAKQTSVGFPICITTVQVLFHQAPYLYYYCSGTVSSSSIVEYATPSLQRVVDDDQILLFEYSLFKNNASSTPS